MANLTEPRKPRLSRGLLAAGATLGIVANELGAGPRVPYFGFGKTEILEARLSRSVREAEAQGVRAAAEDPLAMVFFFTECEGCAIVRGKVLPQIKRLYGKAVAIRQYDCADGESYGLLYDLYILSMDCITYQRHKHFKYGYFDANQPYVPVASGTVSVNADTLTHNFGANLTDAGSVRRNDREYFNATADLSVFLYNAASAGSDLVRRSSKLKAGLDAFIQDLSHATVKAEYNGAAGGTSRNVPFSLVGTGIQFWPTGEIGLGSAGISAGTLVLNVTKQNPDDYAIGAAARISPTIRDIIDFNYFKPGLPDWLGASRSGASIQSGYGKNGSFPGSGQVILIRIVMDGSVEVSAATKTPPNP